MTKREFERLQVDVRAFGVTLGVAVTLRMVLAAGSSSSGAKILLRVFRFVPDRIPMEYPAALAYRPDMTNLKGRIYADIKTAAEQLGAVHPP